ncbi:MAG: hypothetical protein LBC95_02170 [Candidatus Nomurabacteria bacterium]|jgi:hypothetical protein|nr:hypothetical protein [Candidatus Nomurabacteria bacterium]
MKYTFKISFDIEKDARNWYDASRTLVFQGHCWRDNLSGGFRDEFDKICKLNSDEAKVEAGKFVKKLRAEKSSEYRSLEAWIKNDFDEKFDDACKWLEKNTGHKLFCENYTVYLTTFPRADEFPETGELFHCIYWINPIENFLHEVLHWQFQRYWRADVKSPVLQLPNDEWEILKESLTVVIDDELKPLIRYADKGYPAHQDFRKTLYKHWREHHNFDKLIEFGLEKLPEFTK